MRWHCGDGCENALNRETPPRPLRLAFGRLRLLREAEGDQRSNQNHLIRFSCQPPFGSIGYEHRHIMWQRPVH